MTSPNKILPLHGDWELTVGVCEFTADVQMLTRRNHYQAVRLTRRLIELSQKGRWPATHYFQAWANRTMMGWGTASILRRKHAMKRVASGVTMADIVKPFDRGDNS